MARKTVLEIFQLMCPTINLPKPTAVFSSGDNSIIKLTAFLHEACAELLGEHDWQFLRREFTITTEAGVADYDFPANVERFTSATFYDRTRRWDVPGSLTGPQMQSLKAWQTGLPFSQFTIADDQITFQPVPAGVFTFAGEYIADFVANSSGQIPKSDLTEDSDVILFDHRLVIALVKLKWLGSNGRDTTQATDDYNDILSSTKGQDTPQQIISAAGQCAGSPWISMRNFPESW